jgi:hypothetical protein
MKDEYLQRSMSHKSGLIVFDASFMHAFLTKRRIWLYYIVLLQNEYSRTISSDEFIGASLWRRRVPGIPSTVLLLEKEPILLVGHSNLSACRFR